MRTGSEYLRSLNDGRQVFVDGECVKDVTTHRAFREAVRSIARLYDIAAAPEMRERMERAPDLAFRCKARELDRNHRIEAGERLVHRDPFHALDAENRAQVMEVDRFHRDPADDARFARRYLADEGGQNRTAPPGDCGHLHAAGGGDLPGVAGAECQADRAAEPKGTKPGRAFLR